MYARKYRVPIIRVDTLFEYEYLTVGLKLLLQGSDSLVNSVGR